MGMRQLSRGILGVTPWLLACALIAFPVVTEALGLGKLRVLSALNEPLNAEIELTSVTDRELKGLNVTLAPADAYESAGVERMPYLSKIKFIVSKRGEGQYFLKLSSAEPLDEPFLHLLLQVEWPGTRLVREYTALIDLPTQVAGAPATVAVPQVGAAKPEIVPAEEPPAATQPAVAVEALPPTERKAAAAEAATAERPGAPEDRLLGPEAPPSEVAISPVTGWPEQPREPAPEAAPAVTELAPRAAEPTAAPAAAGAPSLATVGEYHVKTGDTLWEISERVRADKSLAVEQVILAIFRVNPDAFFGKNVNNLRAGKILRIPEREEIEALPVAQARREFRAQYDVWQEYKLKLAGASRALKVAEAEVPPAPAEAKPLEPVPPAKEEKAAAKPARKDAKAPADLAAAQDELLKIVRAEAEGKKPAPDQPIAQTEAPKDAAQRERQALGERVTTLEESLVSKQLEAKELGDKIGVVREQLKREARLIEIEKKEAAPAAPTKPEAPKPEPAKVSEAPPVAKPEAPAPVEAQKPAAEAPKPAEPAPAKPKPAARKPVAPPPPVEEKSVLSELADSVLGGELMPVLLGVVVLAAGAIGIVYLRRRRRSIAEFEESILSAEAVSSASASTTDATSGQAVASGDTSFLSDFSQGGMGNIHTDEVDPIAEAEVYLAYGRDETAEEILKEAVVKNPQREELKVKLLEIYHQRNDVNAFATLAEELYAQTGGKGGKHWDKVSDLGRKLDPANPMFRGGKPAAKAAAAAPVGAAAMADTLTGLEAEPSTVPPAKFGQTTGNSETLDFDLGAGTPAEQQASAPASDFDFDLGGPAQPSAPESVDFGATMKMEKPLDFGATPAAGMPDTGLETLEFGSAPEDNVIDFAPSKPAAAPPATPEFGLGGEEFADLGVPAAVEEATPVEEAGGMQQWDETATKLDLAKAYIDMGDAEGARSILDEVMSEGNEQQKKQARELAAQIG
jgi:pilus assembly protein FimV